MIRRITTGNGWSMRSPDATRSMWNHCKVEQVERAEQAGARAGVWSHWRCQLESLGQSGEHTATKSSLLRYLVNLKRVTDFKGFEALHNIVLDIDDQLLCSDVQTEAEQMYGELWQSFETFPQNINKLTLYVKLKKIMHLRQMTLHDMFKQ